MYVKDVREITSLATFNNILWKLITIDILTTVSNEILHILRDTNAPHWQHSALYEGVTMMHTGVLYGTNFPRRNLM